MYHSCTHITYSFLGNKPPKQQRLKPLRSSGKVFSAFRGPAARAPFSRLCPLPASHQPSSQAGSNVDAAGPSILQWHTETALHWKQGRFPLRSPQNFLWLLGSRPSLTNPSRPQAALLGPSSWTQTPLREKWHPSLAWRLVQDHREQRVHRSVNGTYTAQEGRRMRMSITSTIMKFKNY